MDATQRRRGLTLGRLLLLALLAGIAWCALSVFASTPSASAAENDQEGSGLLGTVTQTVSGVGEVVSGVTEVVDPVVTTVVETVVVPAAEPLPAPVAEPVGAVVESVTTTVDETVAAVDDTATTVVDTATATVADVGDAALVGAVAEPVVELATSVPIVGDVLVETGLDTAVTELASGLDSTVETVVGTPGETGSILPELPLTGVEELADALSPSLVPVTAPPASGLPDAPSSGIAAIPLAAGAVDDASDASSRRSADPPHAEWVRHGAPEGTGASASISPPASGTGPSLGGTLGGAIGGSSSASVGGASGASGALAHEDAHRAIYSFTTLRTTTDDALPGVPVFDTDVSPD